MQALRQRLQLYSLLAALRAWRAHRGSITDLSFGRV